jgi:hypothetical protein
MRLSPLPAVTGIRNFANSPDSQGGDQAQKMRLTMPSLLRDRGRDRRQRPNGSN